MPESVRLGVVADLHGNGPAFRRVLAELGRVDAYIGLGDYLYPSSGSWPIVDWVRAEQEGGLFVRGNHDERAELAAFRSAWRRDPTELYDVVSVLSERIERAIAGHRLVVQHDYPVHPAFAASDEMARPLAPEVNLRLFRRSYVEHYVDLRNADIFLWGGYHLPYVEVHPDLILCNPGAAGLTADQRLDQVSCAVIELAPDRVVIDHRRVTVPLHEVVADVEGELRGVAAERSWLVTRFQGESKIHTGDWKVEWGRIEIPKENGTYRVPDGLWDLQERTPQPRLPKIACDESAGGFEL